MKNLNQTIMNSATFEIKAFVPKQRERYWEPHKLRMAIEAATGVDITTPKRERKYSETRFIFFHLADKHSHARLAEIGRHVKRTHATVIHGLKQFDSLYQYDLKFRRYADEVIGKVMTGI